MAQLVIDPAASQERPPIVKIDLHRSPHGDPSANRKALSNDGCPSVFLAPQQDLAEERATGQEQQPDEKTGTALPEEPFELQVSNLSAVSKVVVEGCPDQLFRVLSRPLVQVMRNLSGTLGENSCAQLTMNSSASSSRSFSMNGKGSIELKSWFTSRSLRLMVCGCPCHSGLPLRLDVGWQGLFRPPYGAGIIQPQPATNRPSRVHHLFHASRRVERHAPEFSPAIHHHSPSFRGLL